MKYLKLIIVALALLPLQKGFSQEEVSEEILELQTKAFLALEQGKEMLEVGEIENAVNAYRRALAIYRNIREKNPDFKKDTLDWRISLCGNQIAELSAQLQRTQPETKQPALQPSRDGDGKPPPPPFNSTPIQGYERLSDASDTPPAAVQVKPPAPVMAPQPRVRPTSPELKAEAADLEYMSKYIALLEEVKTLKQKMVTVQTREETSNVTIRQLSKQVDELKGKDTDMLTTIQKLNARNTDLLDGLDTAKSEQTSSEEARQSLETEMARLKVSLQTIEEDLEVKETKLRSLETEFQDNKKRITNNNRKVDKMSEERDAETVRANTLAVEVAKLKGDMIAKQAEAEEQVKSMEAAQGSREREQDQALKDTKKSLVDARRRNTDLLSDYELAEAKVASLEDKLNELSSETNRLVKVQVELAELQSAHEEQQATLAEKEAQLAKVDEDLKRLEELETLYVSSEKEVTQLEEQLNAQEERLMAASEGDEGLQKQLKVLIAEKTDLSTQLDDLKDTHALMTVDMSTRTGERDDALADSDKALARIKDLQLNIAQGRQEKGIVDAHVKQLELVLAETDAALTDAQKDAGGWLKEKTAMEKAHVAALTNQEKQIRAETGSALAEARKAVESALEEKADMEATHARVLMDQEKSLQTVRSDLREALEESASWKAKTADAMSAVKAEQKAMETVQRNSGSSSRTIAGLQKSVAGLEEDLKQRDEEISKVKSLLTESGQATKVAQSERDKLAKALEQTASEKDKAASTLVRERDEALKQRDEEISKAKNLLTESGQAIKVAQSERDMLAKALEQTASEKDKAASTLVRERDEALKQLEAKEAEISELKKKGREVEQPMRRRSARMNDIVPVPVLEQLGQMTPMIDIKAQGENGFSVEYQGLGTLNFVLPE
ncbi:MAG: chromosome segregation ATPase [Kiritimatiellia bacterium]|jgi:chromosome segregation ATPase